MNKIVDYIGAQFRNPTGIGGKLATLVMNLMNQRQYRATEAALELSDSDTVLDIGFGNGYMLRRLNRHSGCRLYGIDTSYDMLRLATVRNQNAISVGRISLTIADCAKMDFEDEYFDKVYTINTVYFWQGLDLGFAEIYRVLKPGGVFVNAVYSKEYLESLRYTEKGFAKYPLEDMKSAGKRNGFKTEIREIVPGKTYCLICEKKKMDIRLETPADYAEVERLTYDAFLTMELPGRTRTDEHFLAHIMRDSPAFMPELDFVCELDGEIIANIMYTRSKIIRPNGEECETITFGPVSVKPEFHRRGVGSALIRHSLGMAKELGHKAVIITGHVEYYPRFGFKPASRFGLTFNDGTTFDALMALELTPGALGNGGGKWIEDAVFHMDVAEFEKYHLEFLQTWSSGNER